MVRRVLFMSVALAPIVVLVHYLFHPSATVDFVLAATALIPLAWLIGEATEHAAEHTGPGIGGFLNATFGNAPELIIALFAVNAMEFEVVRGSLTGSVVGNLLLVLGFSLLFGGRGEIDRPSSFLALALIAGTTLVLLIPSIPGWEGDPDRDEIVRLSIPVSIVLLIVYVLVTWWSLRRHAALHIASDSEIAGWSLRLALVVLGLATVVTALVAEILVGSIDKFAEDSGLSEFFLAAVVIAIVGNAAEHGGAVVVAYRGKIKLAAEIALASSAQVAVFLIPAVTLLALLIEPLALAFRQVEIAALAISVIVASILLADGRSTRWKGVVLIVVYVGIAIAFYQAGERTRTQTARGSTRIGREVELLDRAGRVAYDTQELATLAALDDAEAVVALGLEAGDVAARRPVDETGLESATAPGKHELVALSPPATEERLDLVGRLLTGQPRIGRRRQRLDRRYCELERELLRRGAGTRVGEDGGADPGLAIDDEPRQMSGHGAAVSDEHVLAGAGQRQAGPPGDRPALVVDHRPDVRHLVERRRTENAIVASREERAPAGKVAGRRPELA